MFWQLSIAIFREYHYLKSWYTLLLYDFVIGNGYRVYCQYSVKASLRSVVLKLL